MRTIIWILEFFLSLILTIPNMIRVKKIKKEYGIKASSEYADRIVRKWVENKFKIAKANIEVKGLENIPLNEKILFVSNHQSDFDIAIIMKYIPGAKAFVSKIEMKKIPILSTWMELMGCVFIDRDSPRNSIKAIVEASKNLKDGINIVIFPEGKRSKSKKVSDFKLGSFKIATKNKAVIVPITIDGSYKLLEEKRKIVPSNVKVTIHQPIYTENLNKEEREKLNNYTRDIIASAIE